MQSFGGFRRNGLQTIVPSNLLRSSAHMRAAAIFGLGCSLRNLKPFQADPAIDRHIDWQIGIPAAADQADVILLFGGDGTINRHLPQLVSLGLPVLVVPAGSGNDLARALGLRHVRASRAAWRRFCADANNIRRIDLGIVTPVQRADAEPIPNPTGHNPGERYFCCAAGVGLDGEVSHRANRLPRWLRGHGGYALSLVPATLFFAPLPVKIFSARADATPDSASQARAVPSWSLRSDRPTVLAVFANTPVYGGGMKVAPRAHMDDGLLDACVVTDIDKFKLFCLFPTVYFGRHLDMSEVEYFQAERFRVETEHPLDVYADGEYLCRTPVDVNVARAALLVVVP
jgi:diacylglycerol kinase (ATP)